MCNNMKTKLELRNPVNDLSLKLMKNSLLTSTLYLVGDSVVLLDSARSIRESINTSFRIEL